TPSDDADKGKVDFTDEEGNNQTVEIEKDPNTGEWKPVDPDTVPPGVTVDPETGKVTIEPDAVQDGSTVTAENSNDNGTSSSETTAGNDIEDTTPPAAPAITPNVDGSVTVEPDQKDAVDLIVEFTDEADQPQKVEVEKGEDGKWTPKGELPEGVTVDPDTGRVDIHYDAVKDFTDVVASNSDDHGNTSTATATATRDPVNGPVVEIQAGEDGVVDPRDVDDNGDVKVDVTFPDDTIKAGDKLVVTNQDGEKTEVVLTPEDITNGKVTVPVKPAEHGNDTTVNVEVKNPADETIGSGSDSAPTDLKVPGDTNGDGKSDTGPVISFPEDADKNGYLNAAEDQDPKAETPVRVELPVNTEAGDIVELTINGEKLEDITLTKDNITDGYVDVPVKLDTTGDGKVDLDKIDATAKVKDNLGNATPEDNKVLNIDAKVPGDVDGDGSAKDPTDPSKGDPDDTDNTDPNTGEPTDETTTIEGAPIITFPEDKDGNGILNAEENGDTKDTTLVRVTTPVNTEVDDTVVITTKDGQKVEVVVTQEDLDNGFVEAEVKLPKDSEGNNTDLTVEAFVKDPAGNESATAEKILKVDTQVPGDSDGDGIADDAGKPVVTITDGDDGFINKGDLNADGEATATVKFPADAGYSVGDKVTITKPDGSTEEIELDADKLANGVEVTFKPQPEGQTNEVTAVVTDPAGNSSLEGKDESITDLVVPGMGDPALAPQVEIADGDDGQIDPADLNADGTVDTTITFPADAGYSAGDTVVIKDQAGNVLVDRPLTADEITNGITVQVKPAPEGEKTEVTAVVTDPADNSSHEGKDSSITDLIVPGMGDAALVPQVMIADGDDGQIDPADVNKDGSVNVTIELPDNAGYSVGDTLTITKPDGSTEDVVLTQKDLIVGVETTFMPLPEGKNNVVTAVVKDPQGNASGEGRDESITDLLVPGDSDGNGIADDAGKPVVTIADGDDGFINKGDLNADGTVDTTITFPADAGYSAGDTVVIKDQAGNVLVDRPLTADEITNGITVQVTPAPEGEKTEVTAVVTDPQGNASGEGRDESITDLVVPGGDGTDPSLLPQVAIADGKDTADQIDASDLNADGTVDTTVTLPANGGYSVGDNIVIKDNAGNTLVDRPLEQADLDNGITVQVTPPADGETLEVTATVTDPQDNNAEGKDSSVVGDTTAPSAPIVDILEGNDNIIDGADLNEDGTTPVKVYLPDDAEEGDKLVINGDEANAITLTKEQIADGNIITNVATPKEGETLTVTAQVIDKAGNKSPVATDDAIVGDITATDAPIVTIKDGEFSDGIISQPDLVNGKVEVVITLPDDAAAGDVLTVTNPDGSTTNYPLTQTDIDAKSKTINYPADSLGDSIEVSAVVTDQAGNTSGLGKADAMVDLKVNAPVVQANDNNADAKDNDGSVSVTPPADADVKSVTVVYTDEADVEQTVTATKDDQGNWSVPANAPKGVTVDADGVITLDQNAVKDGSTVTATAMDKEGNVSKPDSDVAGTDVEVPGDSDGDGIADDAGAPVVTIADTAFKDDGILSKPELNEDGTANVTITLSSKDPITGDVNTNGYQVGDVMTITKPDATEEEVKLTQDIIDNGYTTTFVPKDGQDNTVTAIVTDAIDPSVKSKEGDDTTAVDLTGPEAPTVMFVEDNSPDDGALTADEFAAGNTDGKNEISVIINVPAGVKAEDDMVLKVTGPKGGVTEHAVTQDVIDNGLTLNYPISDFPKDVNRTVTAELVDGQGNVSEPASDTLVNTIVPPTLTVDLQDFIDATDDPNDPDDDVVMATITGTATDAAGSTVTIKVGEYDENGVLIAGTELAPVEAIVQADGTYSVEVDVTSLNNTDKTGDEEQDKHTLGAVATVVAAGGEATAKDLLAEKAADGGFDVPDDETQGLFDATGLNNDMTLVYGPSETAMVRKEYPNYNSGFTISEDTSYTDPFLFTNYDDVLEINNSLNILGTGADAPNDGGNKFFKSADNDRNIVTVDTGMGDDVFSVTQINGGVDARVYMGEGNDTFRTTSADIGRSAIVYMESGDDQVDIANRVVGKLYTGSGSDTVKVGGNVVGTIDLGSGDTPEGYMTEYQDGSGLSLGNDDNIDSFDDVNVLTIGGHLGAAAGAGYVKSGNGKDTVTIKGSMGGTAGELYTAVVDTGANDDTINVEGSVRVNASIYAGSGNDEVNIGGNVIGKMYTQAGDDSVHVTGNVTGSISTDTGKDKVVVDGNVEGGGLIDAGAQDDHIQIKGEVVGSKVWGGSGDDTIIVEGRTRLASEIAGGSGEDNIYVEGLYDPNSVIIGGADSDTIILNTLQGGTITTGDSNWNVDDAIKISRNEDNAVDIVRINELNGGNLYLGEGDLLTGGVAAFDPAVGPFVQQGPFEDAYLQGSNIYYSKADDTLTLKGINGGTIDMGEGNDTIVISGTGDGINKDANHTIAQSHDIKGGNGLDTIEVTGAGNEIYAGDLFSIEVVDLGKGLANAGNIFHTGYIRDYNAAIAQNEPVDVNGVPTKAIFVKGDSADIVDVGYGSNNTFGDGLKANTWTQTATGVEVDGTMYNVWSQTGNAYGGESSLYVEVGVNVI
ncbi:hypothetical protein, partial [Psychrobacter lutiphocae]